MSGSSVSDGSPLCPAWSHSSSRSCSLLPRAPIARTCVASSGTFEVSAWWREITTSGVHLPGVMPSILNSIGSAAGARIASST